jgi:hypothetical protein
MELYALQRNCFRKLWYLFMQITDVRQSRCHSIHITSDNKAGKGQPIVMLFHADDVVNPPLRKSMAEG